MLFKRISHVTPFELIKSQIVQLRDAVEREAQLLTSGLLALDTDWQRQSTQRFGSACLLSEARARLESVLEAHPLLLEARDDMRALPTLKDALMYSASTLFLRDLAAYLGGDTEGRERLAIVTGPITPDGVRVLSRFETLPMEGQSAGFVKAVNGTATQRLIELSEHHGHELHVQAHSHMSYGPAATRPSAIDDDNQRRFAKLGWKAVGLIVSLDGYCRFFDPERDFTVHIYGTDAEVIEDEPRSKVFRLLELPSVAS